MKILAVTACPTGIAHTYMAAEQLELAARRAGWPIKVETQGAMGIENRLTVRELKEARKVLFATDIVVAEPERFRDLEIIQVPVQAAIEDPDGILARYVSEGSEMLSVAGKAHRHGGEGR